MACQDFGRVTASMPIEAQIFEVGIYALAFEQVSDAQAQGAAIVKLAIKTFPGIRTANRKKQKRLGLDVLLQARDDVTLQMDYRREVRLTLTGTPAKK